MSEQQPDPGQQPPPYPTQQPPPPYPTQQQPPYPTQQQPPYPTPQQPPPGGSASGYGGPAPMRPDEARQWATLTHLSCLVGGFVGPVVALVAGGQRDPFLRHHAVTALNFQLTMLVVVLVTIVASFLLVGLFALPFVVVWMIGWPIVAAVKANAGEWWRYPATIPFVS